MLFRLDSSLYPPKEALEGWKEEVFSKLAMNDIRRFKDDVSPFSAKFATFPALGALKVSHFESCSLISERDSRHVADGNDDFQLKVALAGTMHLSQRTGTGGRSIDSGMIGPMTPILCSHNHKGIGHYQSLPNGPGHLLAVDIPRRKLLDQVANAEKLTMQSLPVQHSIVRFFTRYLTDLFEERIPVDAHTKLTIQEHIVDLVCLMLNGLQQKNYTPGPGVTSAVRFKGIQDFISQHYMEPRLRMRQLADGMGMSERSLQMALEANHTTFSELLRNHRLQAAKIRLAGSGFGKSKVSDIAFDVGFSDVSYFNRCFKQAFGESPKAFLRAQSPALVKS